MLPLLRLAVSVLILATLALTPLLLLAAAKPQIAHTQTQTRGYADPTASPPTPPPRADQRAERAERTAANDASLAPLGTADVSNLSASCHPLAGTELPGDVVRWGDGHSTSSAAGCCSACTREPECNSWIWCGNAVECAGRHQQCWLKKRPDPWLDVDVLSGLSTMWTSGITVPPPLAAAAAPVADVSAWHVGLSTADGLIRIRLRAAATVSVANVRAVLSSGLGAGGTAAPVVDAAQPARSGLRFYRAEPVPERWGSTLWPDNYNGGRWGPPYALLQGSFMPDGFHAKARWKAEADRDSGAHPVIRRGMVAWAGGAGGPDFFIGLAKHPEWGTGHTVWGEVIGDDMKVVDAVMSRELVVRNWGAINATELVVPVPFALVPGPSLEDE